MQSPVFGNLQTFRANIIEVTDAYPTFYDAIMLAAGAVPGAGSSETHTLTVTFAGNGSGVVGMVPIPAGPVVTCDPGGDPECTQTYDHGQEVRLFNGNDLGSVFEGWSGDCSGPGDPHLAVYMDSDKTCIATFNRPVLTVTFAGNGSGVVGMEPFIPPGPIVNCDPGGDPECTQTYDYGQEVRLFNSPDPDSFFAGWSGDCSGSGDFVTITMDADKTCIATFTLRNQPPVADPNGPYSANTGESITFDGSGSNDPDGTIVSYDWDFGDGETGAGVSPTHPYSGAGTFSVTLTVTDDQGATDSADTTATILACQRWEVTLDERPLHVADGDQTQPRIKGDQVVFTDNAQGDGDIMLVPDVHAGPGTAINLTNTPDQEYLNDVDGSRVVYTRIGSTGDNDVIVYDVVSNSIVALIAGPTDEILPRISGDYVTLQQMGDGWDVWLHDITGGGVVVAGGPGDQTDASVSGRRVSYMDGTTVKLYEFSTASPTTTVIGAGQQPDVDGDNLVYAAVDPTCAGCGLDIFLYDIPSGTSRNLTQRPGDQTDPTVVGNYVGYDDASAGNFDVWLYFMEQDLHEQVTNEPAHQRLQDVGLGHIVYRDEQNGNADIFVTDFELVCASDNQPPVADANGPYSADEGSPVSFDASGSTDPDGDPLQYQWDLDDDGEFDDATGPTPSETWNDDYFGNAGVLVTDGVLTDMDTATVTISNVAPVANAGPDVVVDEGEPLDFSGSFTDPGGLDTHTVEWDFGDGELSAGTLTPTHIYRDNETYVVTLTVTDDDSGVGLDTLQVEVINVPPEVGPVSVPLDPQTVGSAVSLSAPFSDQGTEDTHTALWSWGDSSTSAGTVSEAAGSGTVSGSHTYSQAGVYTVEVTVTDDDGGVGTATSQVYLVVYDPNGGFVTGGGWIDSPAGAYVPDQRLTGKANFGFVSKYKKAASAPTGNTEFQFKVADLNFKSTSYYWLVIAGARAQYKGEGTINGAGNFGFMLTAIDGALPGGLGEDKFRIKIWDKDQQDATVYDNQMDPEDFVDATMTLGGGSIVIHKKK